MNNLIGLLNRLGVSDLDVQAYLSRCVRRVQYAKNDVLLQQGQTCRYLYHLERGLARGFYYQNDKDITSWLAFEGDIVTSMYSFIRQKPGYEGIELLENAVLYAISYPDLQELYTRFPAMNTAGRLLTEHYYVELEERLASLQFRTAKERYEYLLEKQPQVIQRVSLGHVASYLGITPETLSRIRGQV